VTKHVTYSEMFRKYVCLENVTDDGSVAKKHEIHGSHVFGSGPIPILAEVVKAHECSLRQPYIAEALHQSVCDELIGESAWMRIKSACPKLDVPLVGKEDGPGVQATEFTRLAKLQRPFQKEIQLGFRIKVGLRKQD